MTSTLYVDNLIEKTSGNGVHIPGHMVQCVSTTKIDTFSTSSGSYTDIANFTLSITPTSSSSKILVSATLTTGGTNYNAYLRLVRGSTGIGLPTGTGNRPVSTTTSYGWTNNTWEMKNTVMEFLDSPATTSLTTYKIQVAVQGGGTFHLNRSHRDLDETTRDGRGISTITLMEIAQ
jgi:hypothetical protein